MQPWWAGCGLEVGADGLALGGQSVATLAATHGTPLYLYSLERISRRLVQLRNALTSTGCATRIYYALKANRCLPLLKAVRAEGDIGIDACSPREVDHALHAGFLPSEISVTASMLSNRDLEHLASHEVHLNLDSISALRRYAERVSPGTRVGLRLNPGIAVGYGGHPKFAYGNSKLGIYLDAFDLALDTAEKAGLRVDTLHFHCGWGLQMQDLSRLERAFETVATLARRIPTLEVINVGGGLGVRHTAADTPLRLDVWADALRDHFASVGITLACEPGTFVVADSGLLVVEVNTVEEKGGVWWAGVNAGHNLNVNPYHYGIPLEIIHVTQPYAAPQQTYAVAGNINEAQDVFSGNCRLPTVRDGDLLALFPVGAYGSSMASDHCLRGDLREIVV